MERSSLLSPHERGARHTAHTLGQLRAPSAVHRTKRFISASTDEKEGAMSGWNAMSYDAKDNLLRVVRNEAEGMFAMASAPGAWEAPTACPLWQVRDIVGHIIDVTESYFVGFDAARSGASVPDAFGTRAMQSMLDEGAKDLRSLSQAEAVDRLRTDFEKLMEMVSALGPDEWGG